MMSNLQLMTRLHCMEERKTLLKPAEKQATTMGICMHGDTKKMLQKHGSALATLCAAPHPPAITAHPPPLTVLEVAQEACLVQGLGAGLQQDVQRLKGGLAQLQAVINLGARV
jgi:hypothetical protein